MRTQTVSITNLMKSGLEGIDLTSPVYVTKRGKITHVLLSADLFEKMLEKIEDIEDSIN